MPSSPSMLFVRHRAALLLCRPQEPFAGLEGWMGLPGPTVDGEDDERVVAFVAERTGLTATVRRRGSPVTIAGVDCRPLLLETDDPHVDGGSSLGELVWSDPARLVQEGGDMAVWSLYEAVAPTVRSIAADADHGSTYLSVRALEVIRDRAALLSALGEPGEELLDLGRELRTARPDMTALKVRLADVLVDGHEPEAVYERAADALSRALEADERAAACAADRLADASCVFVFSRSGTVERALAKLRPKRVVTTRADPGAEGVAVAERLATETSVALGPDAAIASLIAAEEVDAVLVGADGVDRDGTVTNKVGTRTVATVAHALGVPAVVVTATAKICAHGGSPRERASAGSIYQGTARLEVRADRFDQTPPAYVTALCTEEGSLAAEAIAAIADDHRALLEGD